MHILFVEDDDMIASGLVYALTQEGYRVSHFRDLASAHAALGPQPFNLCLLDLSLPDGSGYSLSDALRRHNIPVIFLTAVDDEANIVRGLEMGAEDYITKPFRLRELLARIKKVLQRQESSGEATEVIDLGEGIRLQTQLGRVSKDGQDLELTALEYRLLLVLVHHRGQILSRNQLLEGIWDVAGNFVNDNTLTVTIKRLREKLGDDSQQPRIIKTVRGMGYRIDV